MMEQYFPFVTKRDQVIFRFYVRRTFKVAYNSFLRLVEQGAIFQLPTVFFTVFKS